MRTSCGTHGPDQPMWIGAFASASLINLLVTFVDPSNHPTISYPAASMIMKYIAAHRPKLQRLGLFPHYELGIRGEEGESSLLAFLSGNDFYEYMADLTSLREISGTLAWFQDEALLALGQLPYLETLAAYSGYGEPGGSLDFKLPDGLFPSLRHLILHDLHPYDATCVLFYGPPLLRNLTSLDVQFYLNGLDDRDQDDDNEWFNEDLFSHLENAPNLGELKLVAFPRDETKNVVCALDESSMRILSALPLHTLSLHYIGFAHDALDMDLATIFPSLTRLEMPSRLVSLATLPYFTRIPSLQYLELCLDLRNEVVLGLDDAGQYDLTTLATGAGGEICTTFDDMDSVARILLSMWPNLTCLAWPRPDEATKPEILKYEWAESLNAHITSLREISPFREPEHDIVENDETKLAV
ncbi:hypothetical protein FRC06_006374 [Ceratobasidium sp. 370]|nr:hypothetical protein FRC06_006374 [Ceratobasidium sp. 370]